MAVETDRHTPAGPDDAARRAMAARLTGDNGSQTARFRPLEALAAGGSALRSWWAKNASWLPLDRFFVTLARRIFLANLLGLMLLIIGILYISQHQAWLISAKRESLRVQGEIIAGAIAANAKIVGSDGITLDPNQLPNVDDARVPFREDAFAALELSLSPEKVAPILRRLIKPTNTRARIYTRDYTLIADSNQMLTRSSMSFDFSGEDPLTTLPVQPKDDRSKPLKNFWTRLSAWFVPSSLPVYREVEGEDISRYMEMRVAMKSGISMEMSFLNDRGQQIVSLVTPIKRNKAVHGVLLLSTRPGEIDDILLSERIGIALISGVALITTIFTSLWLISTISRPMRRLSEAAVQVRRNIKERTKLPDFSGRKDEVGQFAVAFRDMTGAFYRRVEASEKFAADVAHELKNPLTAARSTAEALSYAKDDKTREELVQQIIQELHRLNRLITDVSNASRLEAELALQEAKPVHLIEVLTNVTNAFSDVHRADDISIEFSSANGAALQDFIVNGHEGRLAQVITNLVDNALSFSPPGGVVKVSVERIADQVEIRVSDQGAGIPTQNLKTIFSRFYSDRPATDGLQGKNSGLGLSISQEIIDAHDGRIWAENLGAPLVSQSRTDSVNSGNRAGEGAVFIIRLPAANKNKTSRSDSRGAS